MRSRPVMVARVRSLMPMEYIQIQEWVNSCAKCRNFIRSFLTLKQEADRFGFRVLSFGLSSKSEDLNLIHQALSKLNNAKRKTRNPQQETFISSYSIL